MDNNLSGNTVSFGNFATEATNYNMTKFSIREHSRCDKSVFVDGPMDMAIEIDYDDVDHEIIDLEMENLVKILNEHWTPAEKPVWIQCSTCDEQFRHFKKHGYTQCNECIVKGNHKL